MTTDLQPLRLAVGSHEKGSGKGCAMNVVSSSKETQMNYHEGWRA